MNNDFERTLNEKDKVFHSNLIFMIISKVHIGELVLREREPLIPGSLSFHIFRLC